ncbi:MAG: 2-oxoglutarate dehydrogenase complex dihydrolipoyllysine-residue succinyltransferase [Parachlamydiaceae bacterium]
MKKEIVVPRMGESISEATIGTLLKQSGTWVQADDELLELETDKVNQVIYAPTSGTITWQVKTDDTVRIGDTIGYIEEGESAKKNEEPEQKEMHQEEPKQADKKIAENKQTLPHEQRIVGARKTKESFIQELKTPLQEVSPSVERPTKPQPESRSHRPETRQKLSKVRKVIAERMLYAQATTASLTTFNEIDLTQVMMIRDRYKEAYVKEYGVKLGLMSFFVKAAVSALKEYPEINAYLDGDELVYREYYHIGIAVSTDKGVIVPVVRNCDELSFFEIEKAIDTFAQSAREGKISIDDLQGAGFTITNGGVFGSLLSTPILSPPQTGILGMHKITKRPMVIGDQILIRPMMYVALTYDHRVIDGREAVSFLVHLKQCLEDPARLLLEI